MGNIHYVKTDKGLWFLQVTADCQCGFYLVDEHGQSWDGGLGIASEWTVAHPDSVPPKVQKRLQWLIDAHEELQHETEHDEP